MKKVYELRAELEYELLRNGKTVKTHRQECQSFTKSFKHFIGNFLSGTGYRGFSRLPITCLDGVNRDMSYDFILYEYFITTNIAIGTSDTPFDYTQYELQSKLMDATGLTKSIDLQDYNTSVRFELTGTFNVAVEADVKETGLYGQFVATDRNDYKFLVSRDVLTTPIHVLPNDVLIVRYRITIS